MSRSTFTAERFAACWYGGMFLLTAAFAGSLPDPWMPLGFFGAMAIAALVIPRLTAGLSQGAAFAVRFALFLVAVPVTFELVGRIVPYLSPDRRDTALRHVDRILFGGDPTRWTGSSERWPVVSELLIWVYFSFYLLPVFLAARLAWRRNLAALEEALLVVVAGFLVSYLGYILVPARSPYRLFSYPFEFHGVWAFDRLHEWLFHLEAQRCDAFPSGHSDVTWLVAALAWKHDRKSFYWFFGPVAVLLPIGTVYLRYHYGVDVLAGAFFAIVTWRMCMALEKSG